MPHRWIRWKVLAVLSVLFVVLYFIGMNPLAGWQLNSLGQDHPSARWNIKQVALGLLSGDFNFLAIDVASVNHDETEKKSSQLVAGEGSEAEVEQVLEEVFNAESANFEVSVGEFLRKRFVVDEMSIVSPRMDVRRREDGSSNVGDLGGPPKESEDENPESAEERDWVETAKTWYERLQKLKEWVGGDDDEAAEEEKAKEIDYYALAATYPFAERPLVVVNKILADDLQISLSDAAAEGKDVAKIEKGRVSVTGLSSNPALHDSPIAVAISGNIAGSPLSLGIDIDMTGDVASYNVEFDAGSLSAELIDNLVGKSLPVRLADGTLSLKASLGLDGNGGLKIVPKLGFQNMQLAAKEGVTRVAGLEASQFITAFNEASKALDGAPLNIADLQILGTIDRPEFHWGDTVKNLVLEGGKAFANAQLKKGQAIAQREIDKAADRLKGEATEKIGEVLGDNPLGKEASKVIEGVLPGKKDTDGVLDGAAGRLRGLFGGDKKKDE